MPRIPAILVSLGSILASGAIAQSITGTSGWVTSRTTAFISSGNKVDSKLVNFKDLVTQTIDLSTTVSHKWDKVYTAHGRARGSIELGSGLLFRGAAYGSGSPTATWCCNPNSTNTVRAKIAIKVPPGALARVAGRFAYSASSSTLCKSYVATGSWSARKDGFYRKGGGCSNRGCTQKQVVDTLDAGAWEITLDVSSHPSLCPNAAAWGRFLVTWAKTSATIQTGKTTTSFLGGGGWHGGGTIATDATTGGSLTAELDVAQKEKLSDALSAAEIAALNFDLPGPELLAWRLKTTAKLNADPTITIRIDPAYLGDGVHPQDLSFFAFSSNDFTKWSRVPSTYDVTTKTLSARTGDFERIALGKLPTSLRGTPSSISILEGGKQDLTLQVDAALKGQVYLIFGSASGTSPGTPLGNGMTLPLNVDPYMQLAIGLVGSPIYPAGVGLLDATGKARMAFALPKGLDRALVGLELAHACWVYDLGGARITHASNAVPVSLVH